MASERQANETDSPWWGEHVHRYDLVAAELKSGDTVLDIACGSGFGSHRLAANIGATVIGGDIDNEAIVYCQAEWRHPSLSFQLLDATDLPFPDATFDAVVTFETVEHTTQYRQMLQELNRVLKSDGRLYLSTPNILVNSPTGIVTNPYHTQEFTYQELEKLLTESFTEVEIKGQQYSRFKQNFANRPIAKQLGRAVEFLFYQRLIRKLPTSFKDAVMKLATGYPHYPTTNDYQLVAEEKQILDCKTFFAVGSRKNT